MNEEKQVKRCLMQGGRCNTRLGLTFTVVQNKMYNLETATFETLVRPVDLNKPIC